MLFPVTDDVTLYAVFEESAVKSITIKSGISGSQLGGTTQWIYYSYDSSNPDKTCGGKLAYQNLYAAVEMSNNSATIPPINWNITIPEEYGAGKLTSLSGQSTVFRGNDKIGFATVTAECESVKSSSVKFTCFNIYLDGCYDTYYTGTNGSTSTLGDCCRKNQFPGLLLLGLG